LLPLPWKWFIEYTHPTQAHMHGIERYVYSGQSAFQKIDIIDTEFFGRCLVLDGKIQSAEFDEYIYHEALIHPAMVTYQEPKRVLVVGGGEGAVLREILKHPSVEKLVMIDIDKEVVELCEIHLPKWNNGTFDDPRVKLLFMDARRYLEEVEEKWDIIFIDLPEPLDDSPCYLLFTKEFYQIIRERLNPKGIVALQAGELNPRLFHCHSAVYNTLKQVFKHVDSYGTFIPSYNTRWSFICASEQCSVLKQTAGNIDKKLEERQVADLLFYDGLTHTNMFTLTKDIRMLRSKGERVIEDDSPLFTY
jgi:spermidine synthase